MGCLLSVEGKGGLRGAAETNRGRRRGCLVSFDFDLLGEREDSDVEEINRRSYAKKNSVNGIELFNPETFEVWTRRSVGRLEFSCERISFLEERREKGP